MNKFEKVLLENYYTKKQFKKIQTMKLGIAGAGGLGSNIAHILVRSGFKYFEIIDFDKVELSNCNRQLYFLDDIGKIKVECLKKNLLTINPNIKMSVKKVRLTSENTCDLFKDTELLFEAFDNVTSKKLIFEQYGNTDRIIIAASGIAGYKYNDDIKIRKINKKHFIVGDEKTGVTTKTPPLAPKVHICAAIMASIALEIACE